MTKDTKTLTYHIIEIVFSVALTTWFLLTIFYENAFVIKPMQIISNFSVLFGPDNAFLSPLSFLIFLIPVITLIKIAAPFLSSKLPFLFSPDSYIPQILNLINSIMTILIVALFIIINASNINYFARINPFTYIMIGLALAANIYQLVLLIQKIKTLSAVYRKFITYIETTSDKDKKTEGKVKGRGILQKLLFSVISTILAIIILLSLMVLRENRESIISSVIEIGATLADQTSNFVRQNATELSISIPGYFARIQEKNERAKLKFEAITVFWRYNLETPEENGRDIYYKADYSTLESEIGNELPEDFYEIEDTKTLTLNKMFKVIAPIFLGSGENKTKLGFSIVSYQEDVIYESYFRNVIKIVLFSILALYLAIILIYILGDNIVRPIRYLQMNVNNVGTALSNMVKGKKKISAAGLNYEDAVKTKDEIKSLSLEIGTMMNVIKGIIPYISASTFKHSDQKTTSSVIKDLTFLFTDIRGFTALCEGKKPAEVVALLNHYLEIQTQVILKHKGDVDKFVGDEIFASFDGPDKELNACKTAMELRTIMMVEKEKRTTAHKTTVEIGIGINTGKVVFGSVGAHDRMDFTSIGDNVNIAARLEGANKAYKTKTLITEAVFKKIVKQFVCRQIDYMTVKGKSKPITIYEILQTKKDASKKILEIKTLFEKGLEFYRKKDWTNAIKYFAANIKKYADGASDVFLERCKYFKKNPPPKTWDGVFALTAK